MTDGGLIIAGIAIGLGLRSLGTGIALGLVKVAEAIQAAALARVAVRLSEVNNP
jgi:hypothetical protein